MDYQFIHSVAKGAYVDLPSAKPIPQAYMTELRKYAGAGDGINAELGSCNSYFTLKPGNEASVAFCSHIERKKNARYPCNFIQSAGWTVRNDMLLNDFDAIIAQDFFTEDQVDAFVDNSQVPPVADHGQHELPKVNIHRKALRAVLYGCFRQWQMSSAAVRIAVPQSEMARYNEYVLGAVKEIYSYFPVNMRAAIGFCSYITPQHAANYPCFGIIFMPQSESDSKTLLLDGSSIGAYEAIPQTTGLKPLDRMIEYILGLNDPGERKQFLMSVYQTAEAKTKGNEFTPMAYCLMGEILQMLDDKIGVQELIPLWIAFSENKQKYHPNIAEELDQYIDKRLTTEQLKIYIERTLAPKPTLKELMDLEKSLLRLSSGRKECMQSLWDDLQNRLRRNAYPPEAVYKMLCAEEQTLTEVLGLKAVNQLREEWARKVSEELRNREIQEMHRLSSQTTNVKQLDIEYKNRIAAFSKAISPYASGPMKDEMCTAVQNETDKLIQEQAIITLQKLNRYSFQTQTEIKNALTTIDDLLRVLPKSDSSLPIAEQLQTMQQGLQAKMNSSQTVSRELTSAVSSEKNYFAALMTVGENISRLSPEDTARVKEQLKKCRPVTRRTYLAAFKNYFGSSLSTAALRDKTPFFKNTVTEDLTSFYSQPQELTFTNKDTGALLRELHALEHEAELLGVKTSPRIMLSRNSVEDAETVEQLCAIRCWSKSLTAQKFTAISDLLFRKGVYRKEQLSAIIDMALSLNADLKILTQSVFEGCVPDMDKDDYQRFVDTLREALVKNGTVSSNEVDGWICKTAKTSLINEEAAKVVHDLRRKEQEKERRKKLFIIIAATAAAVIVAGTGIALVIHFLVSPDKPAETVITMEDTVREAFLGGTQSGVFDVSQRNLSSEARHDPSAAASDDLHYVAQYYTGSASNPESGEMTAVLPLTPEELSRLRLEYLSTLNLSGNQDLTSLSALAGLEGIQKLILDDCTGLRPEALRELKNVRALAFLSLRNIPEVTEALVSEVANHNNPSCLVRWTQNGQEMCFLDGNVLQLNDSQWTISNASDLERLRPILNDLDGLRSLKLTGAGLTAEDLAIVWEMQGLEALDLSEAELRDGQMAALTAKENPSIPQGLCVLALPDNNGLDEKTVEQLKTVLPDGCYIDRISSSDASHDMVSLAGESYPRDTTELDLHGRRLSRTDLFMISRMEHLTTLNLANTGITELPDMSMLTGLIVLDASQNELGEADLSMLKELTSLQELRLAACGLSDIPDLFSLENLKRVDLSWNPLTFDGLCIGSERGFRLRLPEVPLRTLYLTGCGINTLPSVWPAQLEILDLSGNSFETADLGELRYLVFLKELSLSRCGLTRIDLRTLESLQRLDLSGNNFEKLDVDESLPHQTLKGLSIANNKAEVFDLSELSSFKELTWLDLTGIKNAQYVVGEEQAASQAEIARFALDSIQSLRVLIIEENEDLGDVQADYPECRILYHAREDTDW